MVMLCLPTILHPWNFTKETYTGLDINKNFQRKIVNIFLPIILAYALGAQKNHLIETVLLSTHNICFS